VYHVNCKIIQKLGESRCLLSFLPPDWQLKDGEISSTVFWIPCQARNDNTRQTRGNQSVGIERFPICRLQKDIQNHKHTLGYSTKPKASLRDAYSQRMLLDYCRDLSRPAGDDGLEGKESDALGWRVLLAGDYTYVCRKA
jgi:hypothetical protein